MTLLALVLAAVPLTDAEVLKRMDTLQLSKDALPLQFTLNKKFEVVDLHQQDADKKKAACADPTSKECKSEVLLQKVLPPIERYRLKLCDASAVPRCLVVYLHDDPVNAKTAETFKTVKAPTLTLFFDKVYADGTMVEARFLSRARGNR